MISQDETMSTMNLMIVAYYVLADNHQVLPDPAASIRVTGTPFLLSLAVQGHELGQDRDQIDCHFSHFGGR
jgi:hypothetical protein